MELVVISISDIVRHVSTYSPPSPNVPATLILVDTVMCSFMTVVMGRHRMAVSRTMLATCMPMKISRYGMQWPGNSASHAFWTGMHWKTEIKVIRMNQINDRAPSTINHIFRSAPGKILR